MVPLNWFAATGPMTLAAATAYGAGVSSCRGFKRVNGPLPLVRTASSIQQGAPLNTSAPKFSVMVNSPALATIALLVTGPPRSTPPPASSYSVKRRS